MLRRITEHVDPGLPRELPLQPRFDALQPDGTGLPALRLGRHPNNDIVLTSAGIPLLLSRQHALIDYDGEQYSVVDLDTTNGTYVRAPRAFGPLVIVYPARACLSRARHAPAARPRRRARRGDACGVS